MKLEKLNPSVKMFTVLICVILLSVQYLVSLNTAVFLISLFLLIFFSDARPKQVLTILIPAFIAAFGLFVTGLYYARGSSIDVTELESLSAVPYAVRAAMSTNLYTAMQLSTRLLAYAGLGILFALSTDGEFFISSLMHQCHLPPRFAYGILAAIHLMPTMTREFSNVKLAFRTRGMKVHWYSLKPIFTMLVNSIRWSESVAMAMESKGFCGDAKRTYYFIPKVHWYDLVCSLGSIGAILAGMFLLHY
ncbi:MAG: energy-coupling factor transporter transmembrane protein EcfT [Lachnospiraceae bacterium]|nr:energy-coupling factor transporter transmembrane protein EcfT [Lachnospiraceae bacterium]